MDRNLGGRTHSIYCRVLRQTIQFRKITNRRLLQRNHQRPRLPQRGNGRRKRSVFIDPADYSTA
ncbi:hypothetical protein DMP23_07575 [Amycolatopsis sp. A1MSW2902]